MYSDIIDRYNAGVKQKDIIREFHISFKTLRQILTESGVAIRPRGGKRKYLVDEDFFEIIDSEEKAYWVGFILADGCIIQAKWTNRLNVTLGNIDVQHLEKLKQSLSSTHRVIERPGRGVSSLDICSEKLCKDLIKLNVTPRKTYTGTPAIVPDNLRDHYFRGLVDGDGSICKASNKLGYALLLSGTVPILQDFSSWLGHNGKYIYAKGGQAGHVFRLSGYQATINALETLYGSANIYLDRKYKLYQNVMET